MQIKQKQFELQQESESTNGSNLLNSSYTTIEQDLTFAISKHEQSSSDDEEPTKPYDQFRNTEDLGGYEMSDRAQSTFSSMSVQTVREEDDSWYALRERNERMARLSQAQASCNSCSTSVDGKCVIFWAIIKITGF